MCAGRPALGGLIERFRLGADGHRRTGKRRLSTVIPGEFELGTDGPSVILVGVDESVTAARAAAYAAGLARRQGARVVTVYVETSGAYILTASAGASVLAAEAEAHTEIAKELSARARAAAAELGISMTFITARGDAFR